MCAIMARMTLIENGMLREHRVDCDTDGCGNHVHIHYPRIGKPDPDPRMSTALSGWTLDADGLDFCPDCVSAWAAAPEGARDV